MAGARGVSRVGEGYRSLAERGAQPKTGRAGLRYTHDSNALIFGCRVWFSERFTTDTLMPETQTPPEPLARYGKLVRATTGAPTGAYELTVGDLCIRTDEWNKAAAEKWLPVIVAAVNAYSENRSSADTANPGRGKYDR